MMGISRRNRHANKENDEQLNRESRPWDNEASLSKLPKLAESQPIRPPLPPHPSHERFVPLLRTTTDNLQTPQRSNALVKDGKAAMYSSSSRTADPSAASSNFSPVATRSFKTASVRHGPSEVAVKRERVVHTDQPKNSGLPRHRSPNVLSVSDRLRIFENPDESLRTRTSPHVLRNSPFKGALEAFGGATEEEIDRPPMAESPASSDTEPVMRLEHPLEMKRKIGNREVTPIYSFPKPPPLVGLPIPPPSAKPPFPTPVNTGRTSRARASVRFAIPAKDDEEEQIFLSDAEPEERTDRIISLSEANESSGSDIIDDLDGSSAGSDKGHSFLASQPPPKFSSDRLSDDLQVPRAPSPPLDLEDPGIMPRFSYRHSMRLPSMSIPDPPNPNEPTVRSSFRHSKRMNPANLASLGSFPESSSFLDFEDDERLSSLPEESQEKKSEGRTEGVWEGMSFDEPDSFDTFGTLPPGPDSAKQLKASIDEQESHDLPRPCSDESEMPLTPIMSFSKKTPTKKVEDDEDGTLDVPNRFTRRPGAAGALRDLQRASVTAGNEIAASLRIMSANEVGQAATRNQSVSRVQGDILLRSRILRRWNVRYASIVHQGYFGAVLLLFRSDSRGGVANGPMTMRSSKMIALAESSVKSVESRKPNMFMFELKTSQRTYMFACNDEEGREFWMTNLSSSRS